MILYKNTFENIKTINCNFPMEDQFYADDYEVIVADGITRDPIGVSDLNACSFQQMLEKYPRPSGGELAARTVTQTFANTVGDLKERLIKCNQAVKELNRIYIQKCDYLQNDYYGAVAACVQIDGNTLHYAYICDCGIIVYNKSGDIKFQTEDDKERYSDPYINQIGIPWNLPEARVIVRRDYRNNLDNIKNGKCVSYGALTGEETAISFIKSGQLELSVGDIVAVYSDGFTPFLKDAQFIELLYHFNQIKFETLIHSKSIENPEQYGKEKTIVLMKMDSKGENA